MIQITINGDAETLTHLGGIEQALTNAVPLDDVAKVALPTLRIYPPELPGQRYIRTGTLGRGWQYGAAAGDVSGRVIDLFNPVEYAGAVYGDTSQRAIFAGRWKTRSQLAAQIRPQVVAAFRAWVAEVLSR